MKIQNCPICEAGALHRDCSKVVHTLKNCKIEVDQYLHWCDACGMEMATEIDARDNARAMRAAERAAIGRLTGAEISGIRKRLGLTQEQAGLVLGGGPVAFCKYEKDDLAPADAMDNLLWLVSEKPGLACSLAERNGVNYVPPNYNASIKLTLHTADRTLGRQIVETFSAAMESKDNWRPVVLPLREHHASNQSFKTVVNEQDFEALAA